MSNCELFQGKIQHLGHIISQDGIVVDVEKVEDIMNWPTPWNVTNVRYFIGLARYNREFIVGCFKSFSSYYLLTTKRRKI